MAGMKKLNDDTRETEEEGAAVPVQYKSAFASFLSQLATFGGDLSSLTAPSFLLSGVSLLEYSIHWGDFPNFLNFDIIKTTPVERQIFVTKWFISTLYGSYHKRCESGTEKKPFNPVLGEIFLGKWKSGLELVVEQVSHHPPVTAFHLWNKKLNITGSNGQKSKFRRMTIIVEQVGSVKLEIPELKESYFITLPTIQIRGILSGSIFLDLTGHVSITCSNGNKSVIEFIPKPWFSGEYHHIKGTITGNSQRNSDPVYHLSGKWTETIYISKQDQAPEIFFSYKDSDVEEIIVKDLREQNSLESRKLWQNVIKGIETGDYSMASKEKNTIEEKQRKLRKDREKSGEVWKPQFFVAANSEKEGIAWSFKKK
jgi:hypothetical protein